MAIQIRRMSAVAMRRFAVSLEDRLRTTIILPSRTASSIEIVLLGWETMRRVVPDSTHSFSRRMRGSTSC